MTRPTPPLIYNLFPRLAGPLEAWPEHLEGAAQMGFNWLYVNPIFYPGFSGSLYAVKDYGRLDPALSPHQPEGADLETLAPILAKARELGLRPMVDLVINHTAMDSDLVSTHPEWYKRDDQGKVESPWAIDPADARRRTVWGDLAELDYEGSLDKQGLRGFAESVIAACLEVGFEGFRCDAAYKVPADVWSHLIAGARAKNPQTLFLAETLGCRIPEVMALGGAGFDFAMNSSKYWAFDEPWCLDQHQQWQQVAPTISFPESHDTPRLAAETGGLEQVQKQRLVLAALFSSGLLMPMGYERGFCKKLDVVHMRAADWEEPRFDLRSFIRHTLKLKIRRPALSAEGQMEALTPLNAATLVLKKSTPNDWALLLINKDWHRSQQVHLDQAFDRSRLQGPVRIVRPCVSAFEAETIEIEPLRLEPAEIAVVVPHSV